MNRIALIGFGRMGQKIAEIAPQHKAEIRAIVDPKHPDGTDLSKVDWSQIDVAIDFSHPDVFAENALQLIDRKVNLVVGTTGWLGQIERIRSAVIQNDTRFLYGSNFSLGVQLFTKLVRRAGELFGKHELFNAGLHEVHHTKKADAPSGTALSLAEQFLQGTGGEKDEIKSNIPYDEAVNDDFFYVTAQRLGSTFGEHELRIQSPFDDISLRHVARSREAFAAGALMAANWIKQTQPGYYQIEDVVEQVLSQD